MSTFILPLADTKATLETVGGNGLSLAKMIQAGFPIPCGFHITTEAYRAFIEANGVQAKILAALKDVDTALPATLEFASSEIADSICNTYLILNTLHLIPVAVRS